MGKRVEVRRKGEIWEMVNKERMRQKRVNDSIELGEGKDYFMKVLGGVQGKVRRSRKGERGELDTEEEISHKELR